MENINRLFEEQKEKVTNSLSSIYSKEDVLFIIESLCQQTIAAKESTSDYNKEYILTTVKELLEDYSFEEFVSCEPELNGSYGDSYSLEMNTSFDDREFKRSFLSELEDYFTPANNN